MRNPYQILGVSENAGMDEVKKAYRKLSRIYHPDANINNPDKDRAEAKFKEIQAAYQQIVDEKERGTGSYGSSAYGNGAYGNGSYGNFYGQGNAQKESRESTLMQAAGNYLRNGYFREAWNVLNNIPTAERGAKWFYYSAQANAGIGNNITAREHARTAVELEPNNYVYQNLLNRLQSGETWYNQAGSAYGRPTGGIGSFCCECLMFNLFCNCCC